MKDSYLSAINSQRLITDGWMKLLLKLVVFLFILLFPSFVNPCPLEPRLDDIANDMSVNWRLDPSLGIVVRFVINGRFVMYAHPEIGPPGINHRCIPHPRGGCRTMIYYDKVKEVVFIDGNSFHTATSTPVMCRFEGEDWQAFYTISYGERIK